MNHVLAVDDDRSVLHLIKRGLESIDDLALTTAQTAEETLDHIRREVPDVVLLDITLKNSSGLELFQDIHAIDNKLPIIFITASGDSETVIEAMQLGAYNYLVKPLDLEKLRELVKQALQTRAMMARKVKIGTRGDQPGGGDLLVGNHEKMLEVYASIGRVAGQDVTVLIRGENGTGKELVARAIYQHSRRKDGPFLAVNCAALHDTLLESELFGHEKGSFTGAESRRIGKFEQCSGGTIFLDEIGDMAPAVQSKVLRLLQEQRFERVGGNETIETDVRIIAATNRDLEEMIDEGEYRADLYYRLNGFTIPLPSLRERGDDIDALIEYFLSRFAGELGKRDLEGISPEAVEILKAYPWPGNVRELQSVIRQAMLNATGPVIVSEFLPAEIQNGNSVPVGATSSRKTKPAEEEADDEALPWNLKKFVDHHLECDSDELYASALELMERYLLTRVLEETHGNQSQASKILGITRGSLRTKIRNLNISIEQVINVNNGDEDDDDD